MMLQVLVTLKNQNFRLEFQIAVIVQIAVIDQNREPFLVSWE